MLINMTPGLGRGSPLPFVSHRLTGADPGRCLQQFGSVL